MAVNCGGVKLVERHGRYPADVQSLFLHGLGGELLDDRVESLVEQVAPAEHLLDDASRGLALPEPGDGETTDRLAVRLVEVRLDIGVIELYRENRPSRGSRCSVDIFTLGFVPPKALGWGLVRIRAHPLTLSRMAPRGEERGPVEPPQSHLERRVDRCSITPAPIAPPRTLAIR